MTIQGSNQHISPNFRDITVRAMVRKVSHKNMYSFLNTPYYHFKGARRDADGYLWITGRVDDMLNVSGHLMSTAEVEAVLTEHPRVSESAVVSRPHPVKGECLYCFITPNQNEVFDKKLTDELKALVRERIGKLTVFQFF